MGALKSALTAIFNANNYTSSSSGIASKKIPVNESNGLPSGQIGMSDLASVLGDGSIQIDNANNCIKAGTYNFPDTAIGHPTGNGHMSLEVITWTSFVKQTATRAVNGEIYVRAYNFNNGTWTPWYQVQVSQLT
jgi:hypothetical protein